MAPLAGHKLAMNLWFRERAAPPRAPPVPRDALGRPVVPDGAVRLLPRSEEGSAGVPQ
jgi:hypothetical protein